MKDPIRGCADLGRINKCAGPNACFERDEPLLGSREQLLAPNVVAGVTFQRVDDDVATAIVGDLTGAQPFSDRNEAIASVIALSVRLK